LREIAKRRTITWRLSTGKASSRMRGREEHCGRTGERGGGEALVPKRVRLLWPGSIKAKTEKKKKPSREEEGEDLRTVFRGGEGGLLRQRNQTWSSLHVGLGEKKKKEPIALQYKSRTPGRREVKRAVSLSVREDRRGRRGELTLLDSAGKAGRRKGDKRGSV